VTKVKEKSKSNQLKNVVVITVAGSLKHLQTFTSNSGENYSASGSVLLTSATKWSRFMPGLLAFVSARERSEDSLKPKALPA